jgi:hypothetical protein
MPALDICELEIKIDGWKERREGDRCRKPGVISESKSG